MRRREFLAGSLGMATVPFAGLPAALAAMPEPQFPPDFTWGASTSAYQIEGAVTADGRGPSIWDTFSHQPGRIVTGENGDVACDHYHRYIEDVALLAQGGFKAYRFSVSWPRVLPRGRGTINQRGLDFYDRLVDALLEKGVAPWVCLYHWDLPQGLQDLGGWTNRAIADWYADYARIVAHRLGDRVPHWAMFNEPNVHAIFGHAIGSHAPGLTGWNNYLAAQHHQNVAQGKGIGALRSERSSLRLGTVISLQPVRAASTRPADEEAARRFDALWNRANLDPLILGQYPGGLAEAFAPLIKDDDLAMIHQPLDFLGINYYSRAHVVDDPNSILDRANFGPLPAGTETTAMGWPVEPAGLFEILTDLKGHYGNPPVYVMENGACYIDPKPQNNQVDDPRRVSFLHRHLLAAQEAMQQGCQLKGFFAWSLLDNFEWAEGTRRRFGLVYVDFATQERLPKASYHWLSRVMASNG
ncbi:GH1 family beta-glucosidase [Dongia soli]|uniref:Beta-glucosidase n=1 Tax=Dongia soli TaxID=600628 RepID=A0ABU5EA45_9PROT|nr:GH1 family beta-glucosidase [Dongia soli]MDY0882741.1 GH1 family beta-glucosidase [Dongia soli]